MKDSDRSDTAGIDYKPIGSREAREDDDLNLIQ